MTTKYGNIGLLGRTNAGKSTLVNRIVGEAVSIVSNLPQTTRKRALGIYTQDDVQIVFCDTPGLHPAKNKLDEWMNSEIAATLTALDGALYLVDSSDPDLESDLAYFAEMPALKNFPVFLVFSKSDLIDEEKRKKLLEIYEGAFSFKEIYFISAHKKKGLFKLLNGIIKILPEGEFVYNPDEYTAQTEREMVEEYIREAVLRMYRQEVPHSVTVEVNEFKERENGKTYIDAVIYAEKESHKKILIGKSGTSIKKVGETARIKLNKTLGRDIYLSLWVKIRQNWRSSEEWIKRLGYKK